MFHGKTLGAAFGGWGRGSDSKGEMLIYSMARQRDRPKQGVRREGGRGC